MRALKYLLPVIAFAVLAGFLLVGLDRNPQEIPSPLIGKPAPAFTLPLLLPRTAANAGATAAGVTAAGATAAGTATAESAMLDSRSLAGRPYLLNVWASWCLPCLQEHPLLLELSRRKLIDVVGMNYKDRPADATAWLQRHGDPFAIIAADRDGRTAIDFGVYGVPESFLIDAGGVIRFKHVGPLTSEVVERRLLPAIRALPAGGTAATGGRSG
ncbi:MAG: DsbE family thiol:disulfide interchange protein [Lautropia sp.]